MIRGAMAVFTRILFGGTATSAGELPGGPCIFIANHSSHLDFLLIWSLLPRPIREHTRPVAARDYWERGSVRRWVACRLLRAVLVDRGSADQPGLSRCRAGRQAMQSLAGVLDAGDALILFPEGTRNREEDVAPFKSGIYHLSALRPEVPIIPVHLENLNRILPKGHLVPVPLISRVHFGAPIRLECGETKEAFLERCRAAVMRGGAKDG